MRAEGDFEQVGAILSSVLSEQPGAGQAGSARRVAEAWPGVVGADAAANSQPRSMRGGKLVVATSSAAWAQALQDQETEVLARLAREVGAGAVRAVIFRPAGWDPCAGSTAPRPLEADPAAWEAGAAGREGESGRPGGGAVAARRELTARERDAVEEVRRAVTDDVLGERIAAAMRASLERA